MLLYRSLQFLNLVNDCTSKIANVRSTILLILCAVFLGLGFWIGHLSFAPASPKSIAAKIASNLDDELEALSSVHDEIVARLERGDSSLLRSDRYAFYLYHADRLIAWSDNLIVPPPRLVSGSFTVKLIKASGADYVVRKWPLSEGTYLVGQIPLYRQYTIRNDYLNPEWNYRIFPGSNISILEPNTSIGTPVCTGDDCVFKISLTPEGLSVHERTAAVAIALISVSIIMLIIFMVQALVMYGRHSPDLAFVLLVIGLWGLRLLMTTLDFPGMFIRFQLFDPQNFASSNLNRSLGDLLLNELALSGLCYYLFRNYYRFRSIRFVYRHPLLKPLLGVVSALVFFLAFLFPFVVIQTIYNNSAIVLDITQSLRFDTLRITAQVIVILSWVCAFLFSHVLIRLLIASSTRWTVMLYIIAGGLIFTLINEATGQLYESTLWIGFVYFLSVYLSGFHKQLRKVGYATFTYLFTGIVTFALASTVTIHHFTRKEKIESQFRFASNFLIDRDYFAEYLLKDVARKISGDAFIQSRISSPFLSKEAIRQKVRQVFVPSYFNKYDVNILLFGAGGTPLNNRSPTTFADLIKIYNNDTFRTEHEGVYFVNNPTSDIPQRYLVVAPITRTGMTSGYVVLELLLKKIIPESVYPELLIDNRFQQFYRTQDISYAVYGRQLLYSSGNYNYERSFKREYLGDPEIHLHGIVHSGYVHVALEDGNNHVAVVSSPVVPPNYILANFSFCLVLGLSLLLTFIFIQGLITFVRRKTLFFSARIQLVLNLAFFLPLFVVSVTTLRLTSQASQEQLNAEYLGKSKSFGAQVESMLDEYNKSEDLNRIDFENQLTDLAKLFNLDANVYDPGGHLLASSQPSIFENGLASPYSNPEALRRIRQGDNLMVVTEEVGSLNYYVSYTSLKSPQSGTLIGVLALPFFQSLSSLEKIQIRILSNILNVFAVMFIILIVLSYVVSAWLTFPLRFITRSLSKTTLTRINQPLRWNAQDEIGLMVKEYNQMLYKLGESKAELEQSQRERAWRDIAQQVAHEIKNPLTPMKLTLQQLERYLQGGNNLEEKTSKALSSLLSQVDTLNDIASSFSSFAKMPEPEIHHVELIGLIKRIVDLHSQSGTITFKHPSGDVRVMGDPQLLGRIFSNIILNAFQAARPGIPPRVDISLERNGPVYRIQFKDNGKGIDPKVADRVFVPHFSTKRSGSGLGMAISRQGIEQMNGRIKFVSARNEGTTFIIELPVA
jgi:signal transduction histidine kinase